MPRTAVLSAALFLCSAAASAAGLISPLEQSPESGSAVVASVSVEGSDARPALETRPGELYDASVIEKDVRELFATGRFSDVRVETEDTAAGKRITFHLVESPRLVLEKIRTSPEGFPFKAEIPSGTPITQERANQIANEFRSQLAGRGYPDAAVEPELVPTTAGRADLLLHVQASSPVRVGEVNLLGETGLKRKDLNRTLEALKGKRIIPGIPGVWKGWSLKPAYSRLAVDSDVTRLRSLYLSRGYFDASVRLDHTEIVGGKANVNLLLDPGMRYTVRQWQVAGPSIETRLERVRGSFNAKDLCECLFDVRREAERDGVLDFDVRVSLRPVPGTESEVDLVANVHRGQPYRVGRIEFEGNKRFSDSLIRANLLLDESDLLDVTKLRKSLDRLNRSTFFEPMNETNVAIMTNAETGVADLQIRLKEKKMGSWFLSGPVGPMSLAGPLQFSLASRLPSWGRGLFELGSYYASFSLVAYADPFARLLGTNPGKKLLPLLSFQRPFLPSQPWTSGFVITPQLGWKMTAAHYGATQVRERLLPWLTGVRAPVLVLPVTFERPEGDVIMFCEPPEPKLKWVRRGVGIALQVASSVPVF